MRYIENNLIVKFSTESIQLTIRPHKQTIKVSWEIYPVAQTMWICVVNVILQIVITPVLFVTYKVCIAVQVSEEKENMICTLEAFPQNITIRLFKSRLAQSKVNKLFKAIFATTCF